MDEQNAYPGQRLGMPEEGPGSVGSWGRRVLALVIDWFASRLVAGFLIGSQVWTENGAEQFAVFAIFALEATVLTVVLGGSFGQLVLRLAVVRLDGRPINFFQALGRSLLICLVVPPLVFNRDNRGLHDLAFDTVVVRR